MAWTVIDSGEGCAQHAKHAKDATETGSWRWIRLHRPAPWERQANHGRKRHRLDDACCTILRRHADGVVLMVRIDRLLIGAREHM